MRFAICLVLAALTAPAWADGPNLLADPGFEDGAGAWTQHYRTTVDHVIDDQVAHSGARSVRCFLPDAADRTGLTQRLSLQQESAAPLLVSVWYRTQNVTGPPHRSFALVVSVEYITDTRPGQTDDAFIFPFETGTHEWTQLSEVIVPEAPINFLHVHCEMKNRTGTAWFDDLSLRVLSATPLVGEPAELAPWRWEDLPDEFAQAMRAPEDGAFVLYARQMRTQEYHRDPLRLLVNHELRPASGPEGQPGELADALVVEPVRWQSALSGEPLEAPYAHVCFKRRWDERKLLVEAQGREGLQVELWLALPRGLCGTRAHFEGWEPEFDSVEAGALEGRVVLRIVPETMSGRDAIEFDLAQAARELPEPRVVLHEGAAQVATDDRLSLLMSDGRAVGLALDGMMMYSPVVGDKGLQQDGGFYLGDVKVGEFRRLVGGMRQEGGAIEQRVELADLGLRFIARYTPAGNRILVEGEVRDTTGEDRALDLVFKLPARCDGWAWSSTLYDGRMRTSSRTIEPDGLYETPYPVAAVSDGTTGDGIAMALLPDRPAVASFAYSPRSALFHVRFRCGLSAEASGALRSAHPFAFMIFRCDGRWGWRDALERYQAMFPGYFEPRCPVHGKWLFESRPDRLPNPEQFAYDEGSYDFAVDDRFGVGSYPYLIPGQREIKQLPALPRDYAEAMAAFAAFEPADAPANVIRTQRGWGLNIKRIIDNCAATGPDGRRHISIRSTPWGGASVTFFLNMDPDLFADQGLPTVGAHELGHAAALIADEPSPDGLYLDSWSSWGAAVDNCRRDHFPYSAWPLTYDEATGAVCLHGQWSALEFLEAMNDLLHPTGRWVLANMGARVHPFTCMWLDIVGVEGGTRVGRAQVEEFRPVAGRKQLCILEHLQFLGGDDGVISREEYDDYAKRCVVWGAIPSVTWFDGYTALYEANRDLFDRYWTLSVRLSQAGWHALTGARSDQPDVWVERFGPQADGTVLLAIWNSAQEPREVTLTVEPATLGLAEAPTATRLVGEGTLSGEELRLSLEPRGLEVLALR